MASSLLLPAGFYGNTDTGVHQIVLSGPPAGADLSLANLWPKIGWQPISERHSWSREGKPAVHFPWQAKCCEERTCVRHSRRWHNAITSQEWSQQRVDIHVYTREGRGQRLSALRSRQRRVPAFVVQSYLHPRSCDEASSAVQLQWILPDPAFLERRIERILALKRQEIVYLRDCRGPQGSKGLS